MIQTVNAETKPSRVCACLCPNFYVRTWTFRTKDAAAAPFLRVAVAAAAQRGSMAGVCTLPLRTRVNRVFYRGRVQIPAVCCTNILSHTPFCTRSTDIAELDGGKVAAISFPNANDLSTFDVTVSPDSGYWKGATYHFTFSIPPHYPHSPPKVDCKTKIYHPNIDLQGKVCLNILREDWKPVLDINSVIYGLIYLFYEPNPDDPLNHEAAELFRKDVRQFERLVSRTLRGGMLDGVQFDRLL